MTYKITNPPPCEHCWCKQVDSMGTSSGANLLNHEACCMCGTRRLKASLGMRMTS